MRTLRIVIRASAVPSLSATLLAPAFGAGCGSGREIIALGPDACVAVATGSEAGLSGSGDDAQTLGMPPGSDAAADAWFSPPPNCSPLCVSLVALPDPGTPAAPDQLCSVTAPPATSNEAARITLVSTSTTTADGYIAVPGPLVNDMSGLPAVSVASATAPELAAVKLSAVYGSSGAFRFTATWSSPPPSSDVGQTLFLQATMTVICADGGEQTVESVTPIALCTDGANMAWVSAGDPCTQCCRVVLEMAPSPIVSDCQGDDLPLGRALRLRLVELARTATQVLLFAENDAGDGATYEWRVSGGTLEQLAGDLVLWSPPDDDAEPFGQVAVIGASGAAVENFAWAHDRVAA
jgi:hypothetical protein